MSSDRTVPELGRQAGDRLNELDWLRVIIVFAVFLHHVGMPFNGDDWVIMNAASSKLLDDIMVYFEQLRLPTLFMIAGAGASLLLARRAPLAFAGEKFRRLLVPFFVGLILIIPPQLYLQSPDQYASLWSAYPELALQFEAMHLWFIAYLFVFSLIAIPLHAFSKLRALEPLASFSAGWASSAIGLLSFGLLLVGLRVVLKEFYPSDDHSLGNLSSTLFYLFFFLAGFWLVRRRDVWARLGQNWKAFLAAHIVMSLLFYAYYFIDFSAYASTDTLWAVWWGLTAALSWTGALAMLGAGQRFLRHTPDWLTRANFLIYPFYILHQTVIVIFAFWIVQWEAGIGLKLIALQFASFMVTALLCVFPIERFNLTRWLFGLKPKLPD